MGNRLIFKLTFMFKNMLCEYLKQRCRTNRIIKKVIKLEGERISGMEGRKEGRKEKKLKSERFGNRRDVGNEKRGGKREHVYNTRKQLNNTKSQIKPVSIDISRN